MRIIYMQLFGGKNGILHLIIKAHYCVFNQANETIVETVDVEKKENGECNLQFVFGQRKVN